MQVGVVYTSISAYPLLSAYFLTTYAYKRMCLITRVYGNVTLVHHFTAYIVANNVQKVYWAPECIYIKDVELYFCNCKGHEILARKIRKC